MRSLSYRVPAASATRNSAAANGWAGGLSRDELQAELEAWAAAIIKSGIGGVVLLPYGGKYPNAAGFQGGKNDRSKCDSMKVVRRVIRNGFSVYDPPGSKNLVHHDTGGQAIRMADGVIGLDVDNWGGKHGARQLAELEAKWGKLPPAYYLTSRGPDQPSRILLFRTVGGRKYVANASADIEVIQPHHRYAVAPPSIHPDGRLYSLHQPDGWPVPWPDEMPDVSELAQLPAAWDDGLAAGTAGDSGELLDYDAAVELLRKVGTADECDQTDKVTELWVERTNAGEPWESNGAKFSAYRTARDGVWAIINDCALGHEGAWYALEKLREPYFHAGARKGQPEARLADDWRRFVTEAIGKVNLDGERRPDKCASGDTGNGKNGRNLPGESWKYMPELEHIRQAAYSRGRSADSVLGVVRARMSAFAPVGLVFDVGLGPSPITLFSALCGPPEAGKSASIQVGIDLLPEDQFGLDGTFAGDLPLGSGEGIPEAYYATVTEQSGNSKTKQVRKKMYDQAFFHEDEGQKLVKTMAKGGNIIAETIRSAWSGTQIGQKNARSESTRIVNRGEYSIGNVIGFQPETIQGLLSKEEAASGTPQRFLYMNATDPNVPRSLDERPEWPGPLTIEWPDKIIFPDHVCAEVWEANASGASGDSTAGNWSAHMYWMRLRIAAHLAILRNPKGETIAKVTDGDWEWSRVAWETSVSVRDAMREYGSARAAEEEANTQSRIVGRAVAVEAAKEQRTVALDNAIGQAARHVQREKCDGGCKRKCITNAVASKHRKMVDMDIVLSRLVAEGYVNEADSSGIYAPGKKRAI